MIFVEWWLVERIGLGLLMLALSVLGFWIVRKKGGPIRIPVQLFCALVGLCGVLGLALTYWAVSTSTNHSAPVYSPHKNMAARIADYSAGGLGGAYDSVELFTSHGLKSDIVYSGEWNSVTAKDLHWKSDSELEISYEGPSCVCKSTDRVSVRCIRQLRHMPD
jgi:hypothetical protein